MRMKLIKITDFLIWVLGLLLFITVCVLSYCFGNMISLYFSVIMMLSIPQILNLIRINKVTYKSITYNIFLLIILIYTLYFSIINVRELLSINYEEEFSIYLKTEVMIGYFAVLLSNVFKIFVKKEKNIKFNYCNIFQAILILIPLILIILSRYIFGVLFLGILDSSVSLVFFLVFIIGSIYTRNESMSSKVQILYLILIILAIFSKNLTSIIIITIKYIQLDKLLPTT